MNIFSKQVVIVLILVVICIPILVNFICLTHSPFPIVGDGKIWLGFWGAYLGGIVTVLSAIFIFYMNIGKESRQKDYIIQNQFFNLLCIDMGKLCSAIDVDTLCFLLAKMKFIDNEVEIISRIGALDQSIKITYNEFCLKYSQNRGHEGEALIDSCKHYADAVRDSITVILEAIEQKDNCQISKISYTSIIANECNKLKSLGDVTSHLFILAEAWKKREYNHCEMLRKKAAYKCNTACSSAS